MTPQFQRGSLKWGLDAIANYLGEKPQDTYFINEYCVDGKSFPDLSEPSDWVLGDTWASQYLLPLVRNQAKALTLPVPKKLEQYLSSIGLVGDSLNQQAVCQIDDITQRIYPQGSVVGQLKQSGKAIALKGKTIIPSFVTNDLEDLVTQKGAKTLVSSDQSIQFNSKAFLRNTSLGKWRMAPGVTINSLDEFEQKVSAFNTLRQQYQSKQFWAKFATAAGGGTVKLGDNASILARCQAFVANASSVFKSADKSLQGSFRPIVLECDMGAMPNINVEGNYGVQAVVGKKAITYIGTTRQVTSPDGEYESGATLSGKDLTKEGRLWSATQPVFQAYWEAGYRGYMGVDLLDIRDNGKEDTVILEANCRTTAATPLLAVTQTLNRKQSYGEILTLAIPFDSRKPEQSTERFFTMVGEELYRPKSKAGIIPFLIDCYPNSTGKSKARCILVGSDEDVTRSVARRAQQSLGLS